MSSRTPDGSQLEFGDDEQVVALRKAWDRTRRAIAPKLTTTSESFLRQTEPLGIENNTIILATPSRFAQEWLERRYHEALRAQLTTHLGRPEIAIRFVVASASSRPPLTSGIDALNEAEQATGAVPPTDSFTEIVPAERRSLAIPRKAKPLPPELSMPLLPKYTFDTFVVGKSNRLAHAGAMAVANNPGGVYNPLFLYGTPGLGKTHLMHAIGHEVHRQRPEAQVAYVSGEQFTNGYISALREKKSDEFRTVFRNVDVWLVDDVQTIAGKEHTKEEFFHTFNTLYQCGKQIVLSSDRSPRDLRLMDERLKSRFESGLIADVAPPDLEMRVAILSQKAVLDGLNIPDEVLHYMASLIQSNIRSLEGALIRLMAYASMSKSEVTKDLARDVLGTYFVEHRRVMSGEEPEMRSANSDDTQPERSPLRALPLPQVVSRLGALQLSAEEQFQEIVGAVAAHFNVDAKYIAGEGSAATSRRREIAAPRQIAIYLTREKTPLPVTELAHHFGNVDHSAISHAHKKIANQMLKDPQLLATLTKIAERMGE